MRGGSVRCIEAQGAAEAVEKFDHTKKLLTTSAAVDASIPSRPLGILVEPVIEEPGMAVTEIGDEFHGIEVEFATVIGAEDRADVARSNALATFRNQPQFCAFGSCGDEDSDNRAGSHPRPRKSCANSLFCRIRYCVVAPDSRSNTTSDSVCERIIPTDFPSGDQ